ncbi:MAG: lipid-binding SYLF domain-containing protein [Nitrospirota bacterium]
MFRPQGQAFRVFLPRPIARPVARLFLAVALTALSGTVPDSTWAEDREQQDLVDRARMTLEGFLADSNMSWFRDHVKEAKGLFIVPQFLKAAFFFGGAGGSGVLLVRDEQTGGWSEPAFYTMGAGSFGFQFGAQAAEVILLIMTKKGVESMLTSTFKLGADASIAVGPVGAGVEGATAPNLSADLLSFARAKGLFAGVSLEGAVIAFRDEWNSSYYGKTVRPADILIRREVNHPHSAGLREAVMKATAGKDK